MRLDKWLKVSRIIKRRTIAQQACEQSRVIVNERLAKPAQEIKLDDRIEVLFGNRSLIVKVLEIKEHVPADRANTLYEILSDLPLAPASHNDE
jgi:ribosomal 50S subunit-recycling heat shock protein